MLGSRKSPQVEFNIGCNLRRAELFVGRDRSGPRNAPNALIAFRFASCNLPYLRGLLPVVVRVVIDIILLKHYMH